MDVRRIFSPFLGPRVDRSDAASLAVIASRLMTDALGSMLNWFVRRRDRRSSFR
jgi:hypothetical protein